MHSHTIKGVDYYGTNFPHNASPLDVFEIDDPDGNSGKGGFSGSVYNTAFNEDAGFPGRETQKLEVPSASWKDAGLPVT
jgi:hypothetical protein